MNSFNFKVKIVITTIIVLLPLHLAGQTKTLSQFEKGSHSKALYDGLLSDIDTLIIDDIDEPWVFGPMTFRGLKNKVIIFEFGVMVKSEINAFPKKTDALWKFIDCEDITIRGNQSTMQMNKEEYTDGEWRHVIRLRGCKNIDISDLTLRDSGGDGIAVGRSEKVWYSKNIKLKNLQCINNKRQGISITSAEDLWVSDSCFSDTIGTAPGAGLDLECDVKEERMVNVNFKNCVFKNNYYAGVNVGLSKLTAQSEAVSIKFENCLIMNNFSPHNDKIRAEIIIRSHKTSPVKGTVLFKECQIRNSQWSMLYTRKNEAGFGVTFENCTAEDICQNELSSAAIYMEVPHYSASADFGGYHFRNLKIQYSNEKSVMYVRGSKRAPYNNFKNVNGNIILVNPNKKIKPEVTYLSYLPYLNDNVSLEINKVKYKAD